MNDQTQPLPSLPAVPDTLLMLEKKMLIRKTRPVLNVHDVDLVASDDLLILICINQAFLRQTRRTSYVLVALSTMSPEQTSSAENYLRHFPVFMARG